MEPSSGIPSGGRNANGSSSPQPAGRARTTPRGTPLPKWVRPTGPTREPGSGVRVRTRLLNMLWPYLTEKSQHRTDLPSLRLSKVELFKGALRNVRTQVNSWTLTHLTAKVNIHVTVCYHKLEKETKSRFKWELNPQYLRRIYVHVGALFASIH